MARCSQRKGNRKCRQEAGAAGLCVAHGRWAALGVTPDPFYESKIFDGLLVPVDEYLDDVKINSMLNGRYRGDGRLLDQYCPPEGPSGIELNEGGSL